MNQDIRQCKLCGVVKVRIQSGQFDKRNKKYVDDTNKLWNGLVCPPCNHKRMKDLYKVRTKKTIVTPPTEV